MCKQRFAPGQVVVTPGALDLQERRGILLRNLLAAMPAVTGVTWAQRISRKTASPGPGMSW